MDIPSKSDLRKHLLEARRKMSAEEKASGSHLIVKSIASNPLFRAAGAVWLYAADAFEPDLRPLMNCPESRGKKFFFPRYRAEDDRYEMVRINDFDREMRRGRYGIFEPLPELPAADGAGEVSGTGKDNGKVPVFRLIPAVGCDPDGNRLGRGKGYYDRLLENCSGGVSIGVLYECQLAEAIPHEAHDRKLDGVVTEVRGLIFLKEKKVK